MFCCAKILMQSKFINMNEKQENFLSVKKYQHIGEAELRNTFWLVSRDQKRETHQKSWETFENMLANMSDTSAIITPDVNWRFVPKTGIQTSTRNSASYLNI